MTDAHENSQHGHVFRPGPLHRRRAYWLDGTVLHWRIGNSPGHVGLADIASIRLNLPEDTSVVARCVLIEKTGRIHKLCDRCWPSWTKEERHQWGRLQRRRGSFRSLTFTLARRLRKANPDATIVVGPSRIEWIASCSIAILAVGVVAVGASAMITRQSLDFHVAIFMAMAAIQLPMLWPAIRSGGPKPLDPEILHDANPQQNRVDP
jgi:hypothetical protein